MDEKQLKKLLDAVEGNATKTDDAIEQLRAEISARSEAGEWPDIKKALDSLETTRSELEEIKKSLDKYDKTLAAMGGGGESSILKRFDPSYYAPNHGRMMPNAKAAEVMTHYVRAVVTKSKSAIDKLEEFGIEFKTIENEERAGEIHSDEMGGYLLPPEFGGVIVTAMPEYGVAPAHCDVEVMAAKEKTFAADGNDISVYPLEEGGDIDEVDATYQQRKLEAKLFGAFTRWSVDFDEYNVANQGELWARRFARAIAKKIDQCVFLGDGSKTYSNMVGIFNAANTKLVSLLATKTAFSDVTYDDVINLCAAVPDEIYNEGNCRFFGSANIMWLLKNVRNGVGNPIFTDPQSGNTQILGEDYVRTATYPRINDSAAGTKFLSFGDLRRAMKLGIRNRMVLDFSTHSFFTKGQNALRVLSRFGNKASEARAFANLKTADA